MIKHVSAWLLSGGLLAGVALPQSTHAHGSEEFVAFVAGTAVGYLLTADRDVRHVHHHHYGRPVHVVAHPRRYHAEAPVYVVRHHEGRRYHGHRYKHGGWDHRHRGRCDD